MISGQSAQLLNNHQLFQILINNFRDSSIRINGNFYNQFFLENRQAIDHHLPTLHQDLMLYLNQNRHPFPIEDINQFAYERSIFILAWFHLLQLRQQTADSLQPNDTIKLQTQLLKLFIAEACVFTQQLLGSMITDSLRENQYNHGYDIIRANISLLVRRTKEIEQQFANHFDAGTKVELFDCLLGTQHALQTAQLELDFSLTPLLKSVAAHVSLEPEQRKVLGQLTTNTGTKSVLANTFKALSALYAEGWSQRLGTQQRVTTCSENTLDKLSELYHGHFGLTGTEKAYFDQLISVLVAYSQLSLNECTQAHQYRVIRVVSHGLGMIHKLAHTPQRIENTNTKIYLAYAILIEEILTMMLQHLLQDRKRILEAAVRYAPCQVDLQKAAEGQALEPADFEIILAYFALHSTNNPRIFAEKLDKFKTQHGSQVAANFEQIILRISLFLSGLEEVDKTQQFAQQLQIASAWHTMLTLADEFRKAKTGMLANKSETEWQLYRIWLFQNAFLKIQPVIATLLKLFKDEGNEQTVQSSHLTLVDIHQLITRYCTFIDEEYDTLLKLFIDELCVEGFPVKPSVETKLQQKIQFLLDCCDGSLQFSAGTVSRILKITKSQLHIMGILVAPEQAWAKLNKRYGQLFNTSRSLEVHTKSIITQLKIYYFYQWPQRHAAADQSLKVSTFITGCRAKSAALEQANNAFDMIEEFLHGLTVLRDFTRVHPNERDEAVHVAFCNFLMSMNKALKSAKDEFDEPRLPIMMKETLDSITRDALTDKLTWLRQNNPKKAAELTTRSTSNTTAVAQVAVTAVAAPAVAAPAVATPAVAVATTAVAPVAPLHPVIRALLEQLGEILHRIDTGKHTVITEWEVFLAKKMPLLAQRLPEVIAVCSQMNQQTLSLAHNDINRLKVVVMYPALLAKLDEIRFEAATLKDPQFESQRKQMISLMLMQTLPRLDWMVAQFINRTTRSYYYDFLAIEGMAKVVTRYSYEMVDAVIKQLSSAIESPDTAGDLLTTLINTCIFYADNDHPQQIDIFRESFRLLSAVHHHLPECAHVVEQLKRHNSVSLNTYHRIEPSGSREFYRLDQLYIHVWDERHQSRAVYASSDDVFGLSQHLIQQLDEWDNNDESIIDKQLFFGPLFELLTKYTQLNPHTLEARVLRSVSALFKRLHGNSQSTLPATQRLSVHLMLEDLFNLFNTEIEADLANLVAKAQTPVQTPAVTAVPLSELLTNPHRPVTTLLLELVNHCLIEQPHQRKATILAYTERLPQALDQRWPEYFSDGLIYFHNQQLREVHTLYRVCDSWSRQNTWQDNVGYPRLIEFRQQFMVLSIQAANQRIIKESQEFLQANWGTTSAYHFYQYLMESIEYLEELTPEFMRLLLVSVDAANHSALGLSQEALLNPVSALVAALQFLKVTQQFGKVNRLLGFLGQYLSAMQQSPETFGNFSGVKQRYDLFKATQPQDETPEQDFVRFNDLREFYENEWPKRFTNTPMGNKRCKGLLHRITSLLPKTDSANGHTSAQANADPAVEMSILRDLCLVRVVESNIDVFSAALAMLQQIINHYAQLSNQADLSLAEQLTQDVFGAIHAELSDELREKLSMEQAALANKYQEKRKAADMEADADQERQQEVSHKTHAQQMRELEQAYDDQLQSAKQIRARQTQTDLAQLESTHLKAQIDLNLQLITRNNGALAEFNAKQDTVHKNQQSTYQAELTALETTANNNLKQLTEFAATQHQTRMQNLATDFAERRKALEEQQQKDMQALVVQQVARDAEFAQQGAMYAEIERTLMAVPSAEKQAQQQADHERRCNDQIAAHHAQMRRRLEYECGVRAINHLSDVRYRNVGTCIYSQYPMIKPPFSIPIGPVHQLMVQLKQSQSPIEAYITGQFVQKRLIGHLYEASEPVLIVANIDPHKLPQEIGRSLRWEGSYFSHQNISLLCWNWNPGEFISGPAFEATALQGLRHVLTSRRLGTHILTLEGDFFDLTNPTPVLELREQSFLPAYSGRSQTSRGSASATTSANVSPTTSGGPATPRQT